jgi:hypothetical protein
MQAFVVSQVNGTWRTSSQVPGIGALNSGGNAFVDSVSCSSAGKCRAPAGVRRDAGLGTCALS